MIAVVDYGVGNLMSVSNALDFLGLENQVTGDGEAILRAGGVILPGVGAFPDAMEELNRSGLAGPLREAAAAGTPVLGICLGMQLLFTRGSEGRPTEGLGLIPGRVERMETALKLPHIGWNSLELKEPCPLTRGLRGGEYVYFVHSFCALPEDPGNLAAAADYGVPVAAMVFRENVFGCQFHPEKSGAPGLKILQNFGELAHDHLSGH